MSSTSEEDLENAKAICANLGLPEPMTPPKAKCECGSPLNHVHGCPAYVSYKAKQTGFSDEYLMRLKESIEFKRDFQIAMTVGDAKALLARLEAAEAFTKDAYDTHTIHYELYKAWLRSAGKELK